MTENIGTTAGEVWHTLHDKGQQNPSQLKKATGIDDKTLWLALGWLAREDKVDIAKNRTSYKINLKEK